MKRKNVLIKVSGNLCRSKKFLDFVAEKAEKNQVVVICGGGTHVSQALRRAGYKIRYVRPHGRITKTEKEKEIARRVLLDEVEKLTARLAARGVMISTALGQGLVVEPPFLYAGGSVLCHINGDNLVKAYYLGFYKIYVLTLKRRIKNKAKIFQDYPKVEIIGL